MQGVFKRFAKDFGQDFLALQKDVIWPLYEKYDELFDVLVGITTKEVSDRYVHILVKANSYPC